MFDLKVNSDDTLIVAQKETIIQCIRLLNIWGFEYHDK